MTDLHKEGWKLHLVGSAGTDKYSADFANTLRRTAENFPVHFHINAPRDELRDLFRSASIYWHGTGYGFDAGRYPSKQEHFGISTVEAMTAGAVPVVYGSGGQKEIVTNEIDGLYWENIDGLLMQTRRLANDPTLSARLANAAVLSSKRFSREAFTARIDQLIAKLLS
jgi:glycosyltransferase involved in cell wall biosynthesis